MAIKLRTESYQIIGESKPIRKIFEVVEKAAVTDSTVMLFGESGTGKELIARALHHNSRRAGKPFIAVNCAAIPHDLLESELFGYEKGAFTGAVNTRIGRMELAHQGTILLDEVGDMPLSIQVKLLRVLSEREIDRIGGSRSIPLDVRVIAATHRNLEDAIETGKFREDLFYRLNIIPVFMPPLRDRKDDIPLLATHFLKQFNQAADKSIKGITDEAMEILVNYSWPGNIRELANFIERMVVLSSGDVITPCDLPEKVLGEVPREKWTPTPKSPDPVETAAEALQKSFRQSFFMGLPEQGMNLKSAVEDFERGLIL
nr:sigma-54-dependent Fis family transcriptional regulator [Nitrospinaceae bacterium]NIR56632.1 sigma-54-dependent Fis family transcriptional regulator [Nitrospinaceae bacterium]NIS87095.1 sigma-54-dependent Fis family transcriptional regulator [Nitrospinaceae bacterium]NIT83949.1 sigma-54-dependent Fis family transcriptional regulator [Nitrospinaceae bacterium]NIU46140.1 sigma-54-dependent Fis family transcriptional regulator [Nitrospinaceae bacterium]